MRPGATGLVDLVAEPGGRAGGREPHSFSCRYSEHPAAPHRIMVWRSAGHVGLERTVGVEPPERPCLPPAAAEAPESPKGGGAKKLIIIIAAVLLLVLIGGGAAFFLLKKNHAADAEGEGEDAHAAAPAVTKIDPKKAGTPVFLPLDPFTVNLADKDAERYAAGAGITLELDEAKTPTSDSRPTCRPSATTS